MKKIFSAAVLAALLVSCAPEVELIYTFRDGATQTETVKLDGFGRHFRLEIPAHRLANVKSVEMRPEFGHQNACPGCYFVNCEGLMMCAKEGRTNLPKYKSFEGPLPTTVYKTKDQTWMGVLDGQRFAAENVFYLVGGEYSMTTLWELEEWPEQYEDLSMDFYKLGKNAGYSEAALKYRRMFFEKHDVKPLKERIKENEDLAYMIDAPMLRIRQGWKPYPPTIVEQTLENEPEMIVKMTFDDVRNLVDSLKAHGIDKANICLVGWIVRGHDGRDPDTFPVEPSLGGEEKLRELIKYAQDNGFQITGHTNRTDIYHISRHWDEDNMVRKADGSLSPKWGPDSGGQMYDLCLKPSHDIYFPMYEPRVRDLGFHGLEYIDVLSIIRPHECYNPAHPVNRREAAGYLHKMLEETRDLFGCVSSEGGYDYCCDALDFVLYTTMDVKRVNQYEICDEHVPMWQMVFNGYVMSNVCDQTVNYVIKSPALQARMHEYGAHPAMYIYSRYRPLGSNWMGDDDLTMENEADEQRTLAAIRKAYDFSKEHANLQLETLDYHEILPDGRRRSTFSDGTVVTVNYADGSYEYTHK